MPSIKLTVDLEIDGVRVTGFPLIRRITVDEVQHFDYEEAADNDATTFSALPTAQIASIQALLLRPLEQPITLRLDGATDAGIIISAGGMVIIMDATIDAGASTNATVNNPDASAISRLKGFAAGT